jgi:hypothetical protein
VSLAEIDARVNKKAEVLKLTKDQEEEAEACRGELAFAEKELNEANEMELPEGDKREKFDAKKAELQVRPRERREPERGGRRSEERGRVLPAAEAGRVLLRRRGSPCCSPHSN